MSALGFRLRAEMRSRWLAWIGISVLIGLLGAVVAAAAAGARRTDTAYPRLVKGSHEADELVFESTPNPQLPVIDQQKVDALPQVAEVGHLRAFPSQFGFVNAFGSPDAGAYLASRGVNRAHIRSGRELDVSNPNEVMIDYSLASQQHLRVGDTLKLKLARPAAPDQVNIADYTAPPLSVSLVVTAIVATPGQFPPQSGFYFSGPGAYLSPAFVRAHLHDASSYDVSVVRLRRGSLDEAAFLRGVNQLGQNGLQAVVIPLRLEDAATQHTLHLQAVALWILAGLLAAVIILIIVQLLVRQTVIESDDWPALWAMGVTRWQLSALGMVRALVFGLVGGLTVIAGAMILSPLAPIGLARQAEPHPGINLNAAVLALGGAGLLVLALVVSAWPAWRAASEATRSWSSAGDPAVGRSSVIAARIGRSGLPVTVTSGVRMALEPGRGRGAVPVRSTIAGAMVGILALTGAISFGASLDHLVHTPRLYGVTWDEEVSNGNGPAAVAKGIPVLGADRDVEAFGWVETNLTGKVAPMSGRAAAGGSDVQDVSLEVITPLHGGLGPSILAGRVPEAADEVALGSATMRKLHTRIGGTVAVSAIGGDSPFLPAHVVGRAVLEPAETAGHLGDGAVVSPEGKGYFASGAVTTPPFVLGLRYRPGIDRQTANRALDARLAKVDDGFVGAVGAPTTPNDMIDFGHVSYLPFALGGILAGIALLTVVHLLVTSIRRRRRDVAILKTLGFVRRQVLRMIGWQAIALAGAAVVLGVPLGVAAGRWAWTALAQQLGVRPEPVTPLALVLLVVPAILVLAKVVSLVPAAFASRTSPALALRSE